jgi:hypothetical protein
MNATALRVELKGAVHGDRSSASGKLGLCQKIHSQSSRGRFFALAFLAAIGSATITPSCFATGEAVYFSEDFNSGMPNPNLFGYENFTLANGVIGSNGRFSDVNDRRYIRTTVSDYNNRDFRYELTFTTTLLNQTSINFMGIGRGNRRADNCCHNEPWESLYFRFHTPNVADGYIGIADNPSHEVRLGDIPNAGTHRARIEKIGNAITFSVDRHYNGVFSADMSHTFPNINTVAPYLDNLNSRLFFGTVLPDDHFDDMLVAPIPEPTTWLLLVIALAPLARLRGRR